MVLSSSADDDGCGDVAAKKAAQDASKKKRKLDTEKTPGKAQAKKKPKAAYTIDMNKVRVRPPLAQQRDINRALWEQRAPSASEVNWVHESPQKVTDLTGDQHADTDSDDAGSSPLPCVQLAAPAALHA